MVARTALLLLPILATCLAAQPPSKKEDLSAQERQRAIVQMMVEDRTKAPKAGPDEFPQEMKQLQRPIQALLRGFKNDQFEKAIAELKELGAKAYPSIPVLTWHVKEGYKEAVDGHEAFLVSTIHSLHLLGKLSPSDPEVIQTMIHVLRSEDYPQGARWLSAELIGKGAAVHGPAKREAIVALQDTLAEIDLKIPTDHIVCLRCLEALEQFGFEAYSASDSCRRFQTCGVAAIREAANRTMVALQKRK